MAFTPVSYIDDVYYWESDEPLAMPTVDRQLTDGRPNSNTEENAVQIYYIEDSITQHSDTVIKAVIRR